MMRAAYRPFVDSLSTGWFLLTFPCSLDIMMSKMIVFITYTP